ncbi:MAG: hypothetical protein KOO60_07240 [Gemmatimonadales bacterium]|nr:hypothetical protein [Gemmatimonadales bacterium]
MRKLIIRYQNEATEDKPVNMEDLAQGTVFKTHGGGTFVKGMGKESVLIMDCSGKAGFKPFEQLIDSRATKVLGPLRGIIISREGEAKSSNPWCLHGVDDGWQVLRNACYKHSLAAGTYTAAEAKAHVAALNAAEDGE